MNVHGLRKLCHLRNLYKCRSVHKLSQAESEIEQLTKQETKLSISAGGIKVASVENYSPVTQVAVSIKAGSRHELGDNTGIVHCMRNNAILSTKNSSTFTLTRNLETLGAKLHCTATREHLIYTLQCIRDNIDSGIEILADIVNHQTFKPWEVKDLSSRMHIDLAMHNANPEAVLLEALHKAAFKGGLSNSLYSPAFMVGKHNSEMLATFVNEHFTVSRTSVVGLGIPHDVLQGHIDKLFLMNDHVLCKDGPSKFTAREVRIDQDIPYVHAAIVAEGASLNNNKEMLCLGLLQCILGLGNNPGLSPKISKLGEAVAKLTSSPFSVCSINLNYSDSGVFGVYVAGNPEDMNQVVKGVVNQMRAIAKAITDKNVETAKNQLKAKLLFEKETNLSTLQNLAEDLANFGQLRRFEDISKAIDDLKAADVASVAGKVMKAKPAMAAVGRLHSTPHIDELI